MNTNTLKKSILAVIVCCFLCNILTYAENPAYVITNQVPLRYLLVTQSNGSHTLKVDSRTGKIWYLISKKDISKTNLQLFKNLPDIDESQSYDGRFSFETCTTGGGFLTYFMLDSKTGRLWQLDMTKYEAVEIF